MTRHFRIAPRTVGQIILLVIAIAWLCSLFYFIREIVLAGGLADEITKMEDQHAGTAILLFIAILMPLTIGVFGYWMRENFRLSYGIIEVLVAVIALAATIPQVGFSLLDSAESDPMLRSIAIATAATQIAAAVYVFIRGLDNVGQGCKPFPKLDRWWQWLSLRPTQQKAAVKPAVDRPDYPWKLRR